MLARCGETVHISDVELVARCRAGDLDAFGQVYARYERQVFRYAFHLLGNRDDADDVKQETFLKAHRAMKGFRNDCSLLTWLMKIAGNLCRDRIKSQQRRREVLYDPGATQDWTTDPAHAADPVAVVERTQTTKLILSALGGLPAPQRELIVLREIEGYSYDTIASILGCSTASVKLRLFRARGRFKERVESLLKARE